VTWTYSGNPAASPLDEARFLIGDTDTNEQLLQDEEILYRLGQNGGVLPEQAQLALVEDITVLLAKRISKVAGPLSLQLSDRYEHYKELADRIRRDRVVPMPYAGGLFPDEPDDSQQVPVSVTEQWEGGRNAQMPQPQQNDWGVQ